MTNNENLEEQIFEGFIAPLQDSYAKLKELDPNHELLKYIRVDLQEGLFINVRFCKEFVKRFDSFREGRYILTDARIYEYINERFLSLFRNYHEDIELAIRDITAKKSD